MDVPDRFVPTTKIMLVLSSFPDSKLLYQLVLDQLPQLRQAEALHPLPFTKNGSKKYHMGIAPLAGRYLLRVVVIHGREARPVRQASRGWNV